MTKNDELFDRVQQAQIDYITAEFGTEAAECANYGMGTDENLDEGQEVYMISMTTRVYGHGTLTSVASTAVDGVDHDFEEFGK